MRRGALRFGLLAFVPLCPILACGARSSLPGPIADGGTGGVSSTTTTITTSPTTTTTSMTVGQGGTLPFCQDGETLPCGSNVGACKQGLRTCFNGEFGPCVGAIEPTPEQCNGVDDNCDGQIDEGFHLGEPCDDPDSDLCLDSVITCDGCSKSPDTLEFCNGVDDNCNGIVDADCDVGDCQPSLEVTGSTPSSPSCVDFPVEKGSMGIIQYPCTGGPVTAQLGSVTFSGSVNGGIVSLDGIVNFTGPDGCLWQAAHHISGAIASGQLSYAYAEKLLNPMPGCWNPCTEVGTVKITWAAAP
jgi:hypothetical protein